MMVSMRTELIQARLEEHGLEASDYSLGWTFNVLASGLVRVETETPETYPTVEEAFAAARRLLDALTGAEFRLAEFSRLQVQSIAGDQVDLEWRGRLEVGLWDTADD